MSCSSLVLVLLFLSVSALAVDDWKLKMIYQEKGMTEFVAHSRKLGVLVECVNPKMIALTFDDGPE